MNTLNLISGIVTISSLFFSFWIYWKSKKKESVELERLNTYKEKLHDYFDNITAIANQAGLISDVSQRDETTKKEIRHLCISMLYSIQSLLKSVDRTLDSSKKWKFGMPSSYIETVKDDFSQNE